MIALISQLLLSESVNPLKRKLNLDDEPEGDYTRRFLDAVGQPMAPDSRLVDKHVRATSD